MTAALSGTDWPEPGEITERQWQQQVTSIARTYRWNVHHHLHSRGSEPGWPDLVLIGHSRALFVELKTNRGRLRPAQTVWLTGLAAAGLEVAVWRPRDLPDALLALGPRQHRLPTWPPPKETR